METGEVLKKLASQGVRHDDADREYGPFLESTVFPNLLSHVASDDPTKMCSIDDEVKVLSPLLEIISLLSARNQFYCDLIFSVPHVASTLVGLLDACYKHLEKKKITMDLLSIFQSVCLYERLSNECVKLFLPRVCTDIGLYLTVRKQLVNEEILLVCLLVMQNHSASSIEGFKAYRALDAFQIVRYVKSNYKPSDPCYAAADGLGKNLKAANPPAASFLCFICSTSVFAGNM